MQSIKLLYTAHDKEIINAINSHLSYENILEFSEMACRSLSVTLLYFHKNSDKTKTKTNKMLKGKNVLQIEYVYILMLNAGVFYC